MSTYSVAVEKAGRVSVSSFTKEGEASVAIANAQIAQAEQQRIANLINLLDHTYMSSGTFKAIASEVLASLDIQGSASDLIHDRKTK